MPDGERVTTGSEPRRFRLKRPTPANVPFVGDGVHVVAGKKATLKPGEEIEVQEVVESGHDEQTEARKNIERMRELTDEVARLNARIHGPRQPDPRVERLEAELREAREALEWIVTHADMPAGEPWEAAYNEVVDRARGVLEKGTGNTKHA